MNDKNESEKIDRRMKRIGEGFNKFIESIGKALNELFYPKRRRLGDEISVREWG